MGRGSDANSAIAEPVAPTANPALPTMSSGTAATAATPRTKVLVPCAEASVACSEALLRCCAEGPAHAEQLNARDAKIAVMVCLIFIVFLVDSNGLLVK